MLKPVKKAKSTAVYLYENDANRVKNFLKGLNSIAERGEHYDEPGVMEFLINTSIDIYLKEHPKVKRAMEEVAAQSKKRGRRKKTEQIVEANH